MTYSKLVEEANRRIFGGIALEITWFGERGIVSSDSVFAEILLIEGGYNDDVETLFTEYDVTIKTKSGVEVDKHTFYFDDYLLSVKDKIAEEDYGLVLDEKKYTLDWYGKEPSHAQISSMAKAICSYIKLF